MVKLIFSVLVTSLLTFIVSASMWLGTGLSLRMNDYSQMPKVTLTNVTILSDGTVKGVSGAQQYELTIDKQPVIKNGKTIVYASDPSGMGYTSQSEMVKNTTGARQKIEHKHALSGFVTLVALVILTPFGLPLLRTHIK